MKGNHFEQYMLAILGRTTFSEAVIQKYQNILSGSEGERYVTSVVKSIGNIEIIEDFQSSKHNHIQIDCIVIEDNAIYLLEVKNYKGIYTLDDTILRNNFGTCRRLLFN